MANTLQGESLPAGSSEEDLAARLLAPRTRERFVIRIAFDIRRLTPLYRALRPLAAALLLSALPTAGLAVEPASAVKLQNRNGSPFSLESLKGQVVVLDFWASWCIPCRTSFPFLDSLQEKYAPQGLRVVGLTLEDNEDAINAFLDAVLVRFPIVRDPTGHAGDVFNVVAMPTTFLLDREGRVAARF